MRSIVPLGDGSGLFAAMFMLSYLSFGIPVVIADAGIPLSAVTQRFRSMERRLSSWLQRQECCHSATPAAGVSGADGSLPNLKTCLCIGNVSLSSSIMSE
jgi:hypothetical protein